MANLAQRIGQEFKTLRDDELAPLSTNVANIIASMSTDTERLAAIADLTTAFESGDADLLTTMSGKLDSTHSMSLTLTGDVSGLATFTSMGDASMAVTIADDSHNHTVSNIDGLQAALDGAESGAVTTANGYTDARETAITTAYQAYADQSEVDAKAYTDTRETAITTAYQAYADQAEANAEANVKQRLTNFDGNIIPSADITYDLGSPSKQWRDVYVGPGSLYLNGTKVLEDDSGTLKFNADPDQAMTISTSGSAAITVSGGNALNFQTTELNADIALNPTGDIELNGDVIIGSGKALTTSNGSALTVNSNLSLGSNTVTAATFFGNLTGNISATSGTTTMNNLVVDGNLTVGGTTTTVNTETINLADNIITLNSNATGSATQNGGIEVERGDDTNVTLRWNESSDKWEVTEDGATYKEILLSGDVSTASVDGLQAALDGTVTTANAYTDTRESAITTAYQAYADAAGNIYYAGSNLSMDGTTFNVSASPTFSGTVTAADFNSTSDKRLKTNVETIANAGEKVAALRGVNYDWIANGEKTMGVIAQEVEAIIPEVVATDDEGMKSVNYQAMVGLLIEAVKDLQAQVDALK